MLTRFYNNMEPKGGIRMNEKVFCLIVYINKCEPHGRNKSMYICSMSM